MIRKRWLRWVLIACLAPVVLLLAVLLSAPLWLNEGLVKREVTQLVSNATGGKAQFQRIDLHLFPFPGVALSQLRFSLPGTLELEAQLAAVDIRLLPLFFGHVYPHRVRILAPQVRVQLDEPKPSAQPQAQTQPQAQPFSLKGPEASVRDVVGKISAAIPGLAAEIDAGRVELRIGQRPPLVVEQLDVHADVAASAISAKVSCKSNLLERFSAELSLTSRDLSGEGHAEVSGVRVPQLGPVLGIQDGWPVQDAVVNAELKWRMHGLSDAQLDVSVGAPSVAVQFGKAHLELVGPALEAAVQTKGASAELIVRRVAFDSPRLAASARMAISDTGSYSLEAASSDVDLPTLQATADRLAPAVDFLQGFPVRFARGTVTTVKFSTQSATLTDLFDLKALHIDGVVDNVDLSLPVLYDLKVHQASAVGSLERGVVRAKDVQGRLEKSTGRGGTFEMDLNPDVPPLRADITVAVDLPEAFAVAKRVLPDRQSQQALNQVKQLEGSAVAHVALGGNVNNVLPHVEVSAIKASARHELVPFPIRIAGGALTYTNDAVSVRVLDGAVGQSTFTGVSARLGLNTPNVLSAQQGSALLALEELFRWAAAQPQFAKQLDGVKTVSGGLALSVTRLQIPLNKPEQTAFQLSATPKGISIDAPRYGPPARLDGGVIQVSEQSVSASGIKATVLDAALTLSGRTDDYRHGIGSVQAGASGTVGLEALQWVYARAGLPNELRLRGALTVSDANVDWRQAAGVAARGSVNVVGGPAIGFAVRSIPKRLEIETFTVHDDASDATFGGSLEGGHFKAAYKGKLAGSSIEHTFADAPATLGELQGDFHADGDLERPDATTATGYLQGTNIRLPPVLPMPVTIDKLSLEAKDTVLLVKSATVSSGESGVDVSGSVTYLRDKFAVDADVKGKKVVFPTAPSGAETADEPEARPASKPGKGGAGKLDTGSGPTPGQKSDSIIGNAEMQRKLLQPLWEIPLSGTVRVDIGLVRQGRLEISPLVASASLQAGRLDLRLQRAALCGIDLSGGWTVRPDSSALDAKLHARGAQLEKSIACLTQKHVQMTGKADVDAVISAQGKLGALMGQARGTFSATAKDGRINQFDELSSVLKVVNVTQVFAGQMPDLAKAGMAYSTATVDGRIEGWKIFLHKATLDASALKIAAHGSIDYATDKLDVDVLVAPFQTANWVLNAIPIIRSIFGGMIFAVPTHVGGTISSPTVVPLGPSAVGSRLVDMMSNTFNIPSDVIKVPPPASSGAGQPSTAPPAGR